MDDLAPLTRQVYLPVQHQFITFCTLDGYITPNETLLRNNEQTLLCFCSHLDYCLHHSSIYNYSSSSRGLRPHGLLTQRP